MNLLICTGIFPPEIGGPATYSKTLARELSKRGHEIRVITYSTPTLSPPYQGGDEEGVIRITRSWFKPWHYFKYFVAVFLKGWKFDIFYAQDPVSAGYPTFLAAKILQKPLVVKITGDYSWEQAMNRGLTDKLIDEFQRNVGFTAGGFRFLGGGRIKKIREIQIRVCKAANLIITPSEYLKKLVMGWGVKEERIRVIYNAVREVKKFDKHTVRAELGINPPDFLILSIGRNVPWKGFKFLDEVVSKLFSSVIPAEAGIQKNVTAALRPLTGIKLVVLHNTDRETIDKYLNAADLFVLNTGYEGFSHIILEAMSAGLPVITTNVCGNPELIQDGRNGLLVEYNNQEQLTAAILKLYQDPELRKKLVANAKISLEKFFLGQMISQTEAVLKSLEI